MSSFLASFSNSNSNSLTLLFISFGFFYYSLQSSWVIIASAVPRKTRLHIRDMGSNCNLSLSLVWREYDDDSRIITPKKPIICQASDIPIYLQRVFVASTQARKKSNWKSINKPSLHSRMRRSLFCITRATSEVRAKRSTSSYYSADDEMGRSSREVRIVEDENDDEKLITIISRERVKHFSLP